MWLVDILSLVISDLAWSFLKKVKFQWYEELYLVLSPEDGRDVPQVPLPSPVPNAKECATIGETVIVDDSLNQAEQELLETDPERDESSGDDDVVNDGDVEMQDLTADAGKGLEDIGQMYGDGQQWSCGPHEKAGRVHSIRSVPKIGYIVVV